MQLLTKVAVAAIAVAVVGRLGPGLFDSAVSPGSSPDAIDTSTWTTYVSDRYGFSIGHPADWTERPAIGTWTLPEDLDWLTPASEGFKAPGAAILATAWSVPIEPGVTAEDWLAVYCTLSSAPCTELEHRTVPVTMDDHPGSLVRFADDTQAFIPVDDRMYVVAVWEPDSDPRTAPYGGATRLLEGYLSTMQLLPAWVTYDSDQYGFSVGSPPDWTHRSAERDWTFEADAADPSSTAMEHFVARDGDVHVSAWSVPLEPGTTFDDGLDIEAWVATYCQTTGNAPCTGIHDRAVPLCLERRDCHPGLLVPFDDDVQAFFTAGIYDASKMIVVAVWSGESQPAVAPFGGSQRLLEAFLSTMSVWPESVPLGDRVVRAVPRRSPS